MTTNNTRAAGGLALSKSIVFAMMLAFMSALGASSALADDHHGGAYGGGYNPGGYSGPGPALMTVEQARALHDDAWVTLQGHITKNLGGKNYEFKDATGTIRVEISPRSWGGQNIGPDDLVEIAGELDKEWSHVEIEVKRVNKI